MTAPENWTVDPSGWEYSRTIKTTEIGFNETRKLSIAVPAGAAEGAQVVNLLISPAPGPERSLDLRFQVMSKGQ